MKSFRADLALLALAVVGVLSDLACVLTNHTPPGLFEQIALAGLTGAAGIAVQPTQPPASAPAPVRPAVYSGPSTAVFAPSPTEQVTQNPAAVQPPVYTGPMGQ